MIIHKVIKGLYLLDINTSSYYIRVHNVLDNPIVKHPLLKELKFIDSGKSNYLQIGDILPTKTKKVIVDRIIEVRVNFKSYYCVLTSSYIKVNKHKLENSIINNILNYLNGNKE